MVVQEAPQHSGVLVAERGAAGGDRGGYAGQVAGHHVGVALDDHGLRGAGDVPARQIDPVEHLALLVDRGLGGVEVLRLDLVVLEDAPGPEPDGVAGGVADRPEQPPAEAVVGRPALRDQPGRHRLLVAEAASAAGAPAAPRRRAGRSRSRSGPRRPGRTRARPGTGAPGARPAWPAGRRRTPGRPGAPRSAGPLRALRPVLAAVALLAPQLHAVLLREPLHRLDEGQPVDLDEER